MIYTKKKQTYLCWRCKHWEKCVTYRYSNVKADFMEEVENDVDDDGFPVLYITKCKYFKFEQQDVPKRPVGFWKKHGFKIT